MNKNLKTFVFGALFAAIIIVTTAFIKIPSGLGAGYIHIGDTFIYLAASILPAPVACLAAAVGGGLADIFAGAPIYVLPTVIIKAVIACFFSSRGEKILQKRNLFALVFALIITLCGYYFAEVIIYKNFITPLSAVGFNVIQSVASGLLYVAVAGALDKFNFKKRIGFSND